MAFGMKHWMGLTVFGLLLVSVWKLPPAARELRDGKLELMEVKQAEALTRELNRAHRAVQDLRWTDSLSALTVRTAVDGLAMGFPENRERRLGVEGPVVFSIDLSEERKADLRESVRQEVLALTPRADVDFGYYLQPLDHGAVEGAESRGSGERLFVGTFDGQPYCMRVFADTHLSDQTLRRSILPFTDEVSNAAGACRPYLKYGLPGRHVADWMVDGATDFAQAPAQPTSSYFADYRPIRRTFFGMSYYGFRNQSVEIDRCMAGIPEGCLRAVTDPRTLSGGNDLAAYATDVVLLSGIATWGPPFGRHDDYLLADLENEFGAERFRRFWTSELEVPEAFEVAFGIDMGAWVLTWISRSMDISPPGPVLSTSAALGSLLTMLLMAALVGAWARRRRVN